MEDKNEIKGKHFTVNDEGLYIYAPENRTLWQKIKRFFTRVLTKK